MVGKKIQGWYCGQWAWDEDGDELIGTGNIRNRPQLEMVTFRATLRLSMLSASRRTLQNRGTRLGPGRPPLRLKFSASTFLCHGSFGCSSSSSLWQHRHCQRT